MAVSMRGPFLSSPGFLRRPKQPPEHPSGLPITEGCCLSLPPDRPASIRTHGGAVAPVPAGVLISKRVLPSQCRTERLRFRKRPFHRHVAVTRNPAIFDQTLRRPASSRRRYFAMARRPRPSPTGGAGVQPVSAPPPRSHASFRSCPRSKPASVRIAVNPYPAPAILKYGALPVPAACADSGPLPW